MNVLSYNLKKHAAANELKDLAVEKKVDVLCLQEADNSALPERVGDLRLVYSTLGNRLGLAIYANPDRHHVESAAAFGFKGGLHDRIAKPANERLLAVKLKGHEGAESIAIGSFHASPLTALNSLRRDQISSGIDSITSMADGAPAFMIGDFNYPVFRRGLEKSIEPSGFKLSVSDRHTYSLGGVIRGHFDFALHRGLEAAQLQTLPKGASDHLPVLAKLHL